MGVISSSKTDSRPHLASKMGSPAYVCTTSVVVIDISITYISIPITFIAMIPITFIPVYIIFIAMS